MVEGLTSEVQCTTAPLNSWPSSLDTAVFKSAPVSNSTKLHQSASLSCRYTRTHAPLPVVTASLGIDHIQLASASREVFKILFCQYVCSSNSFWRTHLPACVALQTSNLHPVDCSPRTGGLSILRSTKVILSPRASSELDRQSLSLKLGSICRKR